MYRTLILAAEEPHNPVVPQLAEVILGLVAFLLLFFVIKKFVSPRFEVIEHTRVLSITWKALRRAVSASGARTVNDSTAPPRPDCWAMASSCCGCEARPG